MQETENPSASGDSRLLDSERLYYSDSFLTTFTGAVIGARKQGSGEDAVWQISLNRSAFYPTSGGQPFDTGSLRVISQGGGTAEVPVEQVEEDEAGAVWHYVRTPLSVGTPVTGQIDWERRFDHMQQHTGQHLLSAVFLRELQAPTVSFHLGESISTIDLAHSPPGHHSLERVERIANQMIAEDRTVRARDVPRAEAEALLARGELRKLPERQGTIRLIEIAECDLNACGGTHVRSTGQIGGLLLRGVEKVSRGVRIEFACGLRAVRAARGDASILNEAAGMLSVGKAELAAAVGRLLAEGKAASKERQRLREELARFQAEALAREAPVENGLRLLVRAWKDRDREYVRLLASRAAAAASSTAVIFSAHEADPVRIFVARSPDLHFDCGRILREELARLGLRGGGSGDLAQGDVPADREPELRAALSAAIYREVAEAERQG
jgi:alanyl-tRNA synthetase